VDRRGTALRRKGSLKRRRGLHRRVLAENDAQRAVLYIKFRDIRYGKLVHQFRYRFINRHISPFSK
jgi:hypothetical protein